jgi:hypothetical protein
MAKSKVTISAVPAEPKNRPIITLLISDIGDTLVVKGGAE